MQHKKSPLAPKKLATLKPVRGVSLAVLASNLRYKNRDDVLLVTMPEGTKVAGVFTQSLTAAAPVQWCRKVLKTGKGARALLVNAGNANAATGKAGQALLQASVAAVGKAVGCGTNAVMVASTGIIGRPLPKNALADFVPELASMLGKASQRAPAWQRAAKAIMTTDTFPKWVSRTAMVGGKRVTISGFAKGSGMIAPNMATLLGFVFTDAAISQKLLQQITARAVDKSFNCITVDGDTSTNDTQLVFATGLAGNAPITDAGAPMARDFIKAFEAVMLELALLVVRDGEGAQKLITIDVTGAASDKAAKQIALTIANSPLVKTAVAGEDANWGRILGAAGRAGEKLNPSRIKVSIGGVLICDKGEQVKHYNEAPVTKHMQGRDVRMEVDVGVAKGRRSGKARVWSCDLTHGYIDINGSYRS